MNAECRMTANYHTHTWRCHHASGTEREYVESAIRGGLKVLGFSDHAPVPYRGYVSNVRMLPQQLEDYVTTILSLRDEYRDDIEIRLGLEAEYYPAYFEEQMELFSRFPIEYLLLGQHFIGNEIGEPYSGEPDDSDERLERYCSQSIEAMETGRYLYFAHPDLIWYTGSRKRYGQVMQRLCRKAKQLGVPLEINLHGLRLNRNYPNPEFWRIAGETGNDVIFGSDAHAPEYVVNEDALKRAYGLVAEHHLHLLDPDTGICIDRRL